MIRESERKIRFYTTLQWLVPVAGIIAIIAVAAAHSR